VYHIFSRSLPVYNAPSRPVYLCHSQCGSHFGQLRKSDQQPLHRIVRAGLRQLQLYHSVRQQLQGPVFPTLRRRAARFRNQPRFPAFVQASLSAWSRDFRKREIDMCLIVPPYGLNRKPKKWTKLRVGISQEHFPSPSQSRNLASARNFPVGKFLRSPLLGHPRALAGAPVLAFDSCDEQK